MIYKFDYLRGNILATYDSIKGASIDNNLTYAKVYKMLQQNELKYPRDNYYLAYDRKPRWVIMCYDNENLELIDVYKTIKDASVSTGISQQQIQWQVAKDLPITQNRVKGSTTMFFKREKISY